MHYVELLGLPGSGKSSVAHALVRDHRITAIDSLTQRSAAKRNFFIGLTIRFVSRIRPSVSRSLSGPGLKSASAFVADHPEVVAVVADGLRRVSFDREMLAQLTLDTWSRYAFIERHAEALECVIEHEGLYQRLVGFLWRGVDLTSEYVAHCPRPRTVIFLDIPYELAASRVEARGDVRLGLDKQGQECIERVATVAPATVVRIDATRPLGTVVQDVATTLSAQRES